jgi:hypothetical protein
MFDSSTQQKIKVKEWDSTSGSDGTIQAVDKQNVLGTSIYSSTGSDIPFASRTT